MPVKIRNIIVISLLTLIAVLTALTVYLDRQPRTPAKTPEKYSGNPSLQPVPNENKFTKYEYALPREDNNDESQSVYSPVAQIRGKITGFTSTSVNLSIRSLYT